MQPLLLGTPNPVMSGIYAGDTWTGMTIKLHPDIAERLPAIKNMRMHLRDSKDTLIYEFSSACGSVNGVPVDFPTRGNITIWDAEKWVFAIDSQILPILPGDYIWDIEATDILDIVRTVLKGNASICPDITKGA